MKDIKHEIKNMLYYWFQEYGVQIVLKFMWAWFFKIASGTQETKKGVFVTVIVKK